MKTKKNRRGGGGRVGACGWGLRLVWGEVGVRVDVDEELKFWGKLKKSGSVWGGQSGCERRIEVFVKIKKKTIRDESGGGGGGGGGRGEVRVDVNEELKFL